MIPTVLAVALLCALSIAFAETCIASHYGVGDGYGGRRTASGEVMNPRAMTAAHRTLPFGSRVTVTDVHIGRSVTVRINDRGPFVNGRCTDLSNGAARARHGRDGEGIGRMINPETFANSVGAVTLVLLIFEQRSGSTGAAGLLSRSGSPRFFSIQPFRMS
jgi:rare lipoprotein A